jgi:hypothetical protein
MGLYRPVAQSAQAVAPGEAAKESGSQRKQAAPPVLGQKEPGTHAVQAEEPAAA